MPGDRCGFGRAHGRVPIPSMSIVHGLLTEPFSALGDTRCGSRSPCRGNLVVMSGSSIQEGLAFPWGTKVCRLSSWPEWCNPASADKPMPIVPRRIAGCLC
jgi:hypothetical protein